MSKVISQVNTLETQTLESTFTQQAEKQGIYQFISRQRLTKRELSQQCVTPKPGRRL